MSTCPGLGEGDGVSGIGHALRAIDCRTGETTAYAFGRLFGTSGALMPALTALLALYVAFFAISLLTGRSRIGVSALTPRMLTLGLVLTFATSWAAYQNVVWTLASGAPDQIASLLAGTHGSATIAFADHLDGLFAAIADAAHQAGQPSPATETGITPAAATVGGFSTATALWVCAMLLMLGTAGILVTAKIALAALLAIGPLFIVLALFGSTRGLFEGWLKAIVMFAIVPMLAVLIGGGAIGALTPLVRDIAASGSQPEARDVAVLFLGVCIYCALMAMTLKAATAIVAGWHLPGSREPQAHGVAANPSGSPVITFSNGAATAFHADATRTPDDRVRRIVAGLPASDTSSTPVTALGRGRAISAQIVAFGGDGAQPARRPDRRIAGVGGRFRAAPVAPSKGHVS